MNRLLRISFDILITSIVPIISWLFLSIILDKNLINIFSLTYPIQCIMGMIVAVFGVGANISIYKNNNKNAANNGIFYGIITSIIIYSIILLKCDEYICFMSMEIEIYKTFCIYSIFQIFFHTILQLILTKLYYKEENKKANNISIVFNVINFIVLIVTAIITKDQVITAIITIIVMCIMDIFILLKNIEKIDFKINFKDWFKYNSVSFLTSFMFFLIYFFGFSNSFNYGQEYILAITFATIVTDMQWDIADSIKTVAKIDIAKKNFCYNEHLKNAIKLDILIILSVLVMSIIIYPSYQPDLSITSIFIFLHILDFMMMPFIQIKICYLQLEDSAFKMTLNVMIAYAIRTIVSFISTPFCTIIGQMCAVLYELICTKINYKKYENKNA